VPGPCAAIAALSVAGLPTDRFVFEGFLPAKPSARRARLATLRNECRTIVLYEAPHRLREALNDLVAALGADRRAVVCRELTKRFETIYSSTLEQLAAMSASDPDMSRGEIVIVIDGAAAEATAVSLDRERLLQALLEELTPSQAAKIAARIIGDRRSELYELAMKLKWGWGLEAGPGAVALRLTSFWLRLPVPSPRRRSRPISRVLSWAIIHLGRTSPHASSSLRSEERRVGKECRCRWAAEHERKNRQDREQSITRDHTERAMDA